MNEQSADYDVATIRASLLAKMGSRADAYPTHIERLFPRILAEIAAHWGTAKCDSYLASLMLPTRVDRQGFPPEVATELFRLTTAHDALGLAPKTSLFGWASVEDANVEKKGLLKSE